MILTFIVLSGLYLRNSEVQEVDGWLVYWLGDVQPHGVKFKTVIIMTTNSLVSAIPRKSKGVVS